MWIVYDFDMSEFVKTASIQLTAADVAAIEDICKRWHVKTTSAAIRIALAVAAETPKARGKYRKRKGGNYGQRGTQSPDELGAS